MSTGAREDGPKKRLVWPALASGAWLVGLGLLYGFRPGWGTAVVVWPAWVGMILGVLLAAVSGRKALLGAWAVFGLVFVEESWSVPRGLLPEPPRDLRVISLNCAGGSALAAGEVRALNPDLVLFQESPSQRALEKLAQEMYVAEAAVVWGRDASIIARGVLTPLSLPRTTTNVTAARWTLSLGRTLHVASLRLTPPVMRVDLYDPAAWNDFRRNRDYRAAEAREMQTILAGLGFRPDILGGDWNTPPDRAVQGPLIEGLTDSFSAAGAGWGATCVNPFPCIVRIDQIWSSSALIPTRSRVHKTQHSDHRMVAADYRWSSVPVRETRK